MAGADAGFVRMLRLPEVVARVGLSPTTIWRREKRGDFPARRNLGGNAVAWRDDEIGEWIDALPTATGDDAAVS